MAYGSLFGSFLVLFFSELIKFLGARPLREMEGVNFGTILEMLKGQSVYKLSNFPTGHSCAWVTGWLMALAHWVNMWAASCEKGPDDMTRDFE